MPRIRQGKELEGSSSFGKIVLKFARHLKQSSFQSGTVC